MSMPEAFRDSRIMRSVRARLRSSPFLGHVLTLLSGTVIAQAAVMVITIFLARIYSTEDFGRLTIFASISAMVIAMASGRYDMTIILPDRDVDARVVKRLATRIIIVVSVLSSLVCVLLFHQISRWYGDDRELAGVFAFMGVTVFLVSEVAVLQYWYNRKSDYRTIAINRVQQSVGSATGQLVLGLLGIKGLVGLYAGQTLGQLGAWLNLHRKATALREPLPDDAPTMGEMAKRYRKMPLLNGPNAIIDAIRANGINLLIGQVALGSLGQFNMAWRMLEVPVALINGAIAQVFFQKLATVSRGEMQPLVVSAIKRAVLLGVLPFAAIYVLAPWIFPFVFGPQWDQSGYFARALTPWLFTMLVSSPISQVFVVTETQGWLLAFATVYCVVPLSLLHFSPWELLPTIYALGATMAVLLVVMIALAILSARRFDRSEPPPALSVQAQEG